MNFTFSDTINQSHLEEEILINFLKKYDSYYVDEIKKIDLFKAHLTSQWNEKQKQLFARLFYHGRGHFYKFLWLIGSRTKNLETKEKILENTKEEFGEKAFSISHEQMYFQFARSLNVNLDREIYEEKYYLPFLKQFDKNHIKFIVDAGSESELVSLLSAYERLDNIDYLNLLNLAKSIGVTKNEDLLFFIVHSNAGHFDRLHAMLEDIWKIDREAIKNAFKFIYTNQLYLWQNISAEVIKLND